ncbi:MAG: hypothetical protein OER22_03885 [Gammaproteobacteria bacterium]|nr:hypothetical protein [Gammaproteobacteria bacterium]MDH3373316.1 hypothetical protein [Gammaproteobacteria bacterium]MDH3408155.1 hypothetical protein [Gammaproteobacteria bacterium]MDH3551736.1 hypothetical protein [Gammaproteobacteria bacterium]
MVEAVGPVWAGGFQHITSGEGDRRHVMVFLPDKHNDELQKEGKPPVYYWMPNYVRLARDGENGPFKFHLIRFVGIQGADTNVGGAGEVAGGVMSLSTTSGFPPSVLQNAHDELLERFRGSSDRYWGWRVPATPMFRPIPIVSNITTITNLSPNADGSTPSPAASTPATPAPAGPTDAGGGDTAPRVRVVRDHAGRSIVPIVETPATIVDTRRALRDLVVSNRSRSANVDPWAWRLQGQGSGAIVPTAENAFSGLIGSLPTAILWQGFRGSYSPIAVSQAMKLKLWTQSLRIKITGNWESIFQHFSAALSGKYLFAKVDIQAEFNKMVTNGTVRVELEIDGTLPTSDEMRKKAEERADLITQKFIELAEKAIFNVEEPRVEPAEANAGGGWWGVAFSMKYRRDERALNLEYDQTINEQYLHDHNISSSLEGFFDVIQNDPDAERQYFTSLYLDDWNRKIRRIIKPVVNWPDASRNWVGDPVEFVSAQVGYPDTHGELSWASHVFTAQDTGDSSQWIAESVKKDESEVRSPPAGWAPDKSFIKRSVHLKEPPGASDNPFVRLSIEKNVIELDPGEHGTLSDTMNIEVRADSVGKLEVGPVYLNAVLSDPTQTVEVEFQADGQDHDGNDRPVERFLWQHADQNEPRIWEIYTGDLDYRPSYRYRVHVVVKGSIFSAGREWWGEWNEIQGNGPLMVEVPTPEQAASSRLIVTGTTGLTEVATGPGEPPVTAEPAEVVTPVAPAEPGEPGGPSVPAEPGARSEPAEPREVAEGETPEEPEPRTVTEVGERGAPPEAGAAVEPREVAGAEGAPEEAERWRYN